MRGKHGIVPLEIGDCSMDKALRAYTRLYISNILFILVTYRKCIQHRASINKVTKLYTFLYNFLITITHV